MVLPPDSLVGGRIIWISERLPEALGNGGCLVLWTGILELRSDVAVWPL